jgi:serine/threonine-protein kinase RsbW
MSNPAEIQFQIRSHPRLLCVVRLVLENALLTRGLSADETNAMILAVDEAIANVIRHGYHEATDQPIWVRLSSIYEPTDGSGSEDDDASRPVAGVEVQLRDETQDADLSRIKHLQPTSDQMSGRGVHIIYEAADEVDYQPGPGGRGMCLTLRKFHQRPSSPLCETG